MFSAQDLFYNFKEKIFVNLYYFDHVVVYKVENMLLIY